MLDDDKLVNLHTLAYLCIYLPERSGLTVLNDDELSLLFGMKAVLVMSDEMVKITRTNLT